MEIKLLKGSKNLGYIRLAVGVCVCVCAQLFSAGENDGRETSKAYLRGRS